MLMIIEILFLIAGIWLIASGQIPNPLFRLMFGKGDYHLSSTYARLFGVLLASPLLVGLVASDFEFIYLVAAAIVAIILARGSRQSPLQEYIASGNINGLLDILSNEKDWMKRFDAAEALTRLGDGHGKEYLNNALQDRDEEKRNIAKEILEGLDQ